MSLRIYNTLSRRVEAFTPLRPGEVGVYVCGPNLYGPAHVGHAVSYLVFDVVRRYLEYRGYRVTLVQNFTDIEDRIIETARAEGTTIAALGERYAERFLREMRALNVQPATHYPRATQAIPRMIEIIARLVDGGFAYRVDGDVFYRVTAFPSYGRLSGRSLDEMQAGSRVDVDPRKEHPMDFVLWKAARPGEPSWDSPWGRGRPGWHIECSAMSLSLLGEHLDIHGGGQDVVFPHHENEIAQSEAYTGHPPFVRYWVHNGLLRLTEGQEKMTRHLGNIVTIEEALARYHPDALRVFVLSSHYRSPMTWTDEALEASARGAERLRTAVQHADAVRAEGVAGDRSPSAEAARTAFETAMDDDFNTPRALASVFELATAVNKSADAAANTGTRGAPAAGRELASPAAMLRTLAGVLGLTLTAAATPAQERRLRDLARDLLRDHPDLFDPAAPVARRLADTGPRDGPTLDELVNFIAEGRMRARRQRNWATGDAIRSELQRLGILLEDSPAGSTWRLR